jgi:uncharacterized protein
MESHEETVLPLLAAPSNPAKRTSQPSPKQGSSSHGRRRAGSKPAPKLQPVSPDESGPVRLGVISDSHGYLDPAIYHLFAGVTHIIHAGDFIDPDVLTQLATIAPVTAVLGNVDPQELSGSLPREASGQLPGVAFAVGHKRKRLLKRLAAGKVKEPEKDGVLNLVIFGHEHMPSVSWLDGVLLLNPGTASSPYEEDDDPTVALVDVRPEGLAVTFIPLERRPITET